ncbi:thermostable hemolysin delta-VPH [Gilliamella apicola]|uniref:thermostable hemolysin delta-VPH n=1 Tax=Gilliamella apicola TaxID=1196095 RepID=UPI000A35BAF4|nr:thermostable hemolysin delta-VPH [Gilliamella apicola]OTQ27262.1 thermostable hemolysin delta-VPH [Gilliamella apicola]
MSYFNYHAKAKRLIKDGHLVGYEFVDNWNGIKPALVLYFDEANPMPIREYRWQEYLPLLNSNEEE